MIRRLFFLWIAYVTVFSTYAQTELHGVDFTDHHYSALDSALLRRNSVLYSGRDAWGTVSDANLTIFNKWVKDKEKYYPMMKVIPPKEESEPSPEDVFKEEKDFLYGPLLLKERHPVLRRFLEREFNIKKEILSSLPENREERAGEVRHSIDLINSILEDW